MKKILVFTGPQGSGNHMWSKIFALHPKVQGWSALLDTYWIPHDQEPFAAYWKDPAQLKNYDWSQKDYYVTSISCPYIDDTRWAIPDIVSFVEQAQSCGLEVRVAIIGRDRNILGFQETRIRGRSTFELAQEQYKNLAAWNPLYLSYELLHLYHSDYLRQISMLLGFPVACDDPRLTEILKDDTNQKYIHPIDYHWTDGLMKTVKIK